MRTSPTFWCKTAQQPTELPVSFACCKSYTNKGLRGTTVTWTVASPASSALHTYPRLYWAVWGDAVDGVAPGSCSRRACLAKVVWKGLNRA